MFASYNQCFPVIRQIIDELLDDVATTMYHRSWFDLTQEEKDALRDRWALIIQDYYPQG